MVTYLSTLVVNGDLLECIGCLWPGDGVFPKISDSGAHRMVVFRNNGGQPDHKPLKRINQIIVRKKGSVRKRVGQTD